MPHAGTATAMRISLTIELITIGLVRGDSVAVGASGSQSAQIQASMSGWCVDTRDDCADVVGDLLQFCGSDPMGILAQCMQIGRAHV